MPAPAASTAWPLTVWCTRLAIALAVAIGPESTTMTVRVSVGARTAIVPPVAIAVATETLTAATASKLLRPAGVALVHRELRRDPGNWRLAFDARKRRAYQPAVQRPSLVKNGLGRGFFCGHY